MQDKRTRLENHYQVTNGYEILTTNKKGLNNFKSYLRYPGDLKLNRVFRVYAIGVQVRSRSYRERLGYKFRGVIIYAPVNLRTVDVNILESDEILQDAGLRDTRFTFCLV